MLNTRGGRSQVTEDDPTSPAGQQSSVPEVPVAAPESQQPEVAPPPRSHIPKRWLPLAVIVAVAAVALAIALPLTLGGSSSSVTPTPSTPVHGAITGSYLTGTVQDQRLVFASILETASQVSGSLTVTTSGPAHKHLVEHLYVVTGTVAGSVLDLSLEPANGVAAAIPFTATYSSGIITTTLGTGGTLTLERGTLAMYRLLVKKDRALLLS
jgi:hypothetical protein